MISSASKLGCKALFFCAEPGCLAEESQISIAHNEGPSHCLIELPLPNGWQVVDYQTYCPKHTNGKAMHLSRIAEAVHLYRQEWPLDQALAMVTR